MTKPLQLCLYQPSDWPHGPAFEEIIESLKYGLEECGQALPISCNEILPGLRPILLGAHVLPDAMVDRLPPDTIVYNFEHFIDNHVWSERSYWNWIRRFTVWEYNHENFQRLQQQLPSSRILHVPLGYVPQWTRIPDVPEPDIDVLFYGSLSPRRTALLERLQAEGLRVVALTGMFNRERDSWIARAKIVLNVHMSDDGVFESPRVLYLLANRRCVVTECNRPGELEPGLAGGLAAAPYGALADVIHQLLRDPARRQATAQQGFVAVNALRRRAATILGNALSETGSPVPCPA